MLAQVTEKDLLLLFEIEALTGDYKEYFKTKRNNFFATIQRFRKLWDAYQLLDEIWFCEIDDLHGLRDAAQMLPAMLFIHAHLKYRMARELAFSCCLAEAGGLLRVGIESAAYAHKLYREPQLTQVWLARNDGKAQWKAFKKAFEDKKQSSLYPEEHGLHQLFDHWRQYSDWGSHTTVAALATRFRQTETAEEVGWHSDYFETNDTRIITSLYSLLDASRHMENAFFSVFKARFDLDPELVAKRSKFRRRHEALARVILKQYGSTILSDTQPNG